MILLLKTILVSISAIWRLTTVKELANSSDPINGSEVPLDSWSSKMTKMTKARIHKSPSPQTLDSNKSEKDLALHPKEINHRTNHKALKMLTKSPRKQLLNLESWSRDLQKKSK